MRGLRDLIGFDDVRFDVQGDLRMGSPGFVDRSIRTKLAAPDRMTLSAAQIYPTTGAAASSPRASTWQRGRRETFTATTPRRS